MMGVLNSCMKTKEGMELCRCVLLRAEEIQSNEVDIGKKMGKKQRGH